MTPQEQKQLVEAVKPAIKFLCENFHPHTTIIITQTGVEVVEGVVSIQGINDYLVDLNNEEVCDKKQEDKRSLGKV